MTADMEMIFTFHPASHAKSSNFTYASADFVWKYELQLKTGKLSFSACRPLAGRAELLKTEIVGSSVSKLNNG